MLGIKHIKFDSMTHVFHHKKGQIKNQGRGLSFFYFAPSSTIVAIPLGSNNLPFIFNESTKDYQTVSIQGQISYKISKPEILSNVLDFTIKDNGQYKVNDIEKLNQRIISAAQTATSSMIHDTKLKESIRSATIIEQKIREGFEASEMIDMLGIDILGVNVLAVSATPEMLRALETETREKLQQEADQAIYLRRNFAVEQERIIKETELNTEIAVEEKRKQISKKKMETKVMQSQNDRKLKEMNLETDIAIAKKTKELLEEKIANEKKQADSKGYVIAKTMQPYKEMDWKVLTALTNNTDPKFNVSLAFRELAENADKIGNLNMSPELLESIMSNNNVRKK
ncbi:MAG: SPFH domain-containing protein [Marinicellaceae bacterium]